MPFVNVFVAKSFFPRLILDIKNFACETSYKAYWSRINVLVKRELIFSVIKKKEFQAKSITKWKR